LSPELWQALDWYNVPENSPSLAALKVQAEGLGWRFSKEPYKATPFISLLGGFEEYLARLEKKQRHELRRKMRRASEGGRAVRWYVADGADVESEMQQLFLLMAEDPEKAAFLTDEMRAQMLETARGGARAGWLWLAFLEIDGQKAASSLNFDYGNRLWGYNSGVGRAFLELSPGWVLLGHMLQWACEQGREEFDFMRGDEAYKYRFGAVNRYVVRATALRA
jgi:CelD/BcsL family acetyltransferase involved in cellulose biosynthesis